MLKRILLGFYLLAFVAGASFAQERTVVRDKKAKQILLGRHNITLQWISWDYFGTAR